MTIPGCFPGDAAGNAGAVDQSVFVGVALFRRSIRLLPDRLIDFESLLNFNSITNIKIRIFQKTAKIPF
jgi:hypothetical protein